MVWERAAPGRAVPQRVEQAAQRNGRRLGRGRSPRRAAPEVARKGGQAGAGRERRRRRRQAAGQAAAACPYKLCEGFESGTVGGIPTGWTQLKGYGAGSATDYGLATDQAHSGAMSLQSSSRLTGAEPHPVQPRCGSAPSPPSTGGGSSTSSQSPIVKPTSGVLHITFVALQGTTENRVVDTVEMTNGTHQWIYNVPDDSCCTGSDYNWSFDGSWHCAEWYVDLSTKSYRFFTDGTEVTQIGFTNNANAKMSAWTALGVGEIFYQQPPSTLVMWFDDLAINDSQIGCQ